ncbi:glycosyltransferase family 2 protein [Epilithonimonas mollis]|uniref:Glycosyl transferase family 2 n=1 Tax=Epilithonimonas mollis TaxID=216903 RepID=A0A1M6RQV5_9FLAO|nr:glycosyltransferase family 2 protein [Epilithonimonas mollis]SHK34846.1 Glycosyl transferase family 2 [Epilithonimonas mollis]
MIAISLIIPIYNNVESYLRKCLESVLSQTYKNFEVLLINDGSTDNSLTICEEYASKDNRIKIINKENGGISSARNVGLNESKGEYVCFVDHDDWVDSDFLEVFMENVSDTDLVISNIKDIFSDRVNKRSGFLSNSLESREFNPDDFYDNHNFILTNLPWNKMYKKSIIIENNIRFDEKIKIGGEDLIFVLQYALRCNKIKFVNAYTYNYNRQPGNSVTLNYIRNYYFEAKKIKDALFDILERYKTVSKQEKLYHYFRVAGKAIFEEGKPANSKSFIERYKSIVNILNIPEIRDYRTNYKIEESTDSRFFSIIHNLMKYNQPLFLTIFLSIYFKKI